MASTIALLEENFPVPTSRREVNVRPPITSESFVMVWVTFP
jgi:hypothetical protein